jgi:hypothetical protein
LIRNLSPLNPDIGDKIPDIYDLVDIEKDNQNLPQKKHASKAKELIFLGIAFSCVKARYLHPKKSLKKTPQRS